ncbi:unnamed protein product [Chrysoparadoxa australica]
MVVLSAAITTKNGKALMARQFIDMSRIRIEGLLAAFPKLRGSGSQQHQHTFIETENVRYVYQPMESLFLLLITNKGSNIVEDLETLRLLSKIVPDVCGGVTEDKVNHAVFDIVSAFDEAITHGGHKESITVQQIKANLEMDSHEERLHNMVKQSQEEAAKDRAAHKARELRERQRAMQGMGQGQYDSSGFGSGGGMGGGESKGAIEAAELHMGRMGGVGGGMGGQDYGMPPSPPSSQYSQGGVSAPPPPASSNAARAKGMKLGGASKGNDMLSSLMQEDKLAPIPTGARPRSQPGEAAPVAPAAAAHPITLMMEEKVACQLSRGGGVESLEVKGTLSLTANNDAAARCKALLSVDDSSGLSFQTHPKINKQAYEQTKTLVLKDAAKGFPVGRPVFCLRWSMSSTDEAHAPLTINCWPEEEGGGLMNVNIEYTLNRPMELHDVKIIIPLGSSNAPQVLSIDGAHRHNPGQGNMVWCLDMIGSSNSSGSLEFNIQCHDPEAFFPISVQFISTDLFAAMQVLAVQGTDSDQPIQYGMGSSLSSDNYICS